MRRAVIASPSDARVDPVPASPRPLRLAGAQAIPQADGFDHCLKRPPVFRAGAFVFHVADAVCDATPDAPAWRLGLVIPKRFESSAVARNGIKRRWRAAFRTRRVAWGAEFGAADLVVRLTRPLVDKTVVMPATLRARVDAGSLLDALVARLRARGFTTSKHAG